jgi:hypothetical protein
MPGAIATGVAGTLISTLIATSIPTEILIAANMLRIYHPAADKLVGVNGSIMPNIEKA